MSQQMLRAQQARVEFDVRTDLSTRGAAVKYVIVVDAGRDRGLIANAVSCVSAAIGKAIPDLVGPGGGDAARSGWSARATPSTSWSGSSRY